MLSQNTDRVNLRLPASRYFIFLVLLLSAFSWAIKGFEQELNNMNGDFQEYCWAEIFRARCSHGDVISMKTAVFGRMRVGRCITSDAFQFQQVQPDSLGCSADVLEYFDRVCSGKSSCDVVVPNPDLLKYRPCSAQLAMYLEASYTCLNVVDEDRSCLIAAAVGSPAYVASLSEARNNGQSDVNTRCGSKHNPWVIETQTGQQVNITLLDFGRQEQSPTTSDDVTNTKISSVQRLDSKVNGGCVQQVQYGFIVDKAATHSRNTSICAGGGEEFQRQRFVYQSKGSRVEIVLTSAQSTQEISRHKFLLGFEAVGCSNLVPPVDSWLRRSNNEATVGCYVTRQIWHLRCENGQWKGTFGKCTDIDVPRALAVAAVSFIGLAVCLIIIFVGIGCSRRYQRAVQSTKNNFYPKNQQLLSHTGKMTIGSTENIAC